MVGKSEGKPVENAGIHAVSSSAVARASMTSEERAHVVQLLHQSRKEYLFHVEELSAAQWSWNPSPERWSAGQTAEHILQAEAVLFRKLHQAIESQANPDWAGSTAGKTELLESVMLDRNGKADAPAPTRPQGLSKEETVRGFENLRAQIIRFAEETQIPLKEHTAEHPFPAFKTLNAYQWLLLVPLHSMRHCLQLAEIRATPGYPR
jgi:hypothetical protein